jgi:hypothetical protein
MCAKFWSESLKGRDHMEDIGVHRWQNNIKVDLREKGFKVVDHIQWAVIIVHLILCNVINLV